MPLLARRVNETLWARTAEDELWAGAEFPISLMSELVDRHGGGLSVWQVERVGDPILRRIAAAIVANPASSTKEIPKVEFRLVDRAQVEGLGISVTQSDGKLRDTGINGLHYELGSLNATRAIQLLRLMRGTAKVFPAKTIARFIVQSINKNYLPPEVLTKDFLNALHQRRAVKIVLPKK